MIIDLDRFLSEERPYWSERESRLIKLEERTHYKMPMDEAQRFFYLYQRSSADLAKLSASAVQPQVAGYLEALVSRAYGEIHEVRNEHTTFAPWRWFFRDFPRVFRRRIR